MSSAVPTQRHKPRESQALGATTRFVLTLVFALAVPASGCGRVEARGIAPRAGGEDRASDFTGRAIDGSTVRLSDYLGKQAVLLYFCTTWYHSCLAEVVHVRRIYDKERSRGFVVIAIAMDSPNTVAEVPAWARRNDLVFPVVLDEDSHIASVYNPKKAAPFTVLIDKKGDIAYVHDGYTPGDEVFLERHIASVLDSP